VRTQWTSDIRKLGSSEERLGIYQINNMQTDITRHEEFMKACRKRMLSESRIEQHGKGKILPMSGFQMPVSGVKKVSMVSAYECDKKYFMRKKIEWKA
jgi:hypothetical protein